MKQVVRLIIFISIFIFTRIESSEEGNDKEITYIGTPMPLVSLETQDPIVLSEAYRQEINDNTLEFKIAMETLDFRQRILYTLFYLFVFLIIVLFTILIPR